MLIQTLKGSNTVYANTCILEQRRLVLPRTQTPASFIASQRGTGKEGRRTVQAGLPTDRQSQNCALGLNIDNQKLHFTIECCIWQFLGLQCLAISVQQGPSSMNRLGYSTHNRPKTEHPLASVAKGRRASAREREGAGRKNVLVFCISQCLVLHASQIHQGSLQLAFSFLVLLKLHNYPQAFIGYR